MAPEQLRGLQVDRRADVFASGIVLFELLALRRLFQRRTDYLTFQAVLEEPLKDIRKYRPDTPDALIAVLHRSLAAQPSDRYESARQLRGALISAIGTATWGANEIADFVRTHFADDISRRHANISSAIRRDGKGTLPTVWSSGSADPDEDDEYFIGASHTGMPQITDEMVEEARSRPQVTAPTKVEVPKRLPNKRRSRQPLIFAAIGLGVAAIGVTAYFTLRSPRTTTPAPTPNDPYSLALVPYRAVLEKCAREDGPLPANARANVSVYPNGRAYDVAFEPKAMIDTPLGGCLRDALFAVKFPAADTREQVTITLTMR
jgi:serine/threonine-protein kinase